MIAGVLVSLALTQTPKVEGVFVVRVDTQEVAREAFTIASGRLASGAQGWIVSATARYDQPRPALVLAPTLEIAQDTMPTTLQFDVANPREPVRILGQLGRNRYTVRTVARSFERAREFPVQAPLVVLDDSVFSLYQIAAWFAGPRPVSLIAVVARAPRREVLTLTDAGSDSTVVNRRASQFRHLTLSGGENQLVHLWLDENRQLIKVEIPSRRLVAERAPSD
jgi:hypothetical protein